MEEIIGGALGIDKKILSRVEKNVQSLGDLHFLNLKTLADGGLEYPEECQLLLASSEKIGHIDPRHFSGPIFVYNPHQQKITLPENAIAATSLQELSNCIQLFLHQKKSDQVYESRIKILEDRVQLFRSMLDKSPEGIAITDINGNISALNELATAIFGYNKPEEVIGKNILEIVYPPDHLIAFQVGDEARQKGTSDGKYLRYQHPDGNIIQISLTLSTLIDPQGNFFGYVGSTHQVVDWISTSDKERQKTLLEEIIANPHEKELKEVYKNLESESIKRSQIENHRDFLTKILESTTDIVSYGNEKLELRYLNNAGLAFFGFESVESIQGLHAYDLHPDFMKDVLYDGIIPLVRQNGSWRGENWIENRAGNRIPVSQVITYHPDLNENYAFATIMRDISETKLKEQELKKSREMYQNLAEASQDMILIIDSQYRIQYLNQIGSTLIGIPPEGVIGKSYFSVPGMPVKENDISLIDSILASTKPKYIEGQIQFPASFRWMGTWLVPIQDDQCEYSSILALCRDITHLKQTEEQLSFSLSRERELGELKSRFISLVSHEFRTPLATILSSVELLETYGIHWGSEKRAHHIDRIKNTVQSLDKLLDDILLIGKKDVGILPFRPVEINPIEVCTQIIQDMILTDHRNHQIRFSVIGKCESALMDPNLLRHILVNLLSNAVKFSYSEGKIDVLLECFSTALKITIQDEGIGIPAEDIDQLYEPFNRGKNATNIPGSGLGLTIVKNSIDLCGGTIDIESKQYEGTTIRFTIPFAEKAFSE